MPLQRECNIKADFFYESKINVSIVIPKRGVSGVFNNIPYSYGKLNALTRIAKFKARERKNIIILETLIGAKELIYVLFAKLLGYKVVLDKVEYFGYIEDKMSYEQTIDIKIGLICEEYLEWFADGLLVISTLLADKYKKLKKPILLMPNSVPIYSLVESNKNKFNQPVKIVYAGSFAKKDGVEYLIRACKELYKNYRIELHLIGKGTIENEKRIENEIGSFHSMIYKHGFIEEGQFQQNLLDADILAVTRTNSKFANYRFPYKLTEYLCTGNPIICTRVGDLTLYLENKKNVIFAVAEDVNSIYNALEFCLNNNFKRLV